MIRFKIEDVEDLKRKVLKDKDVRYLAKFYFDVDLTRAQEEIVKAIAFPDNNRIVISCMTRYGKSFCVSIGVLMYIMFNEKKRILLIGPKMEQTKIIRNYVSQFIIASDFFKNEIDIALTGLDRLKSEVSKKRITFKNGCELQILTAEGTAERLMGFGGDLVVLDESCLISYDVYRSKISRMLGDSADSILVEIGNPWDRNNQMWEHWTNPNFKKIHVGYKTALKERRLSKAFLEEQRELLTPIEFKILYEAEFPEEAEDAVFRYKDVMNAVDKFEKDSPYPTNAKFIISCDVADKGMDKTVIMYGYEADDYFTVCDIYSEATSDNMQIAGKIVQMYEEKGADRINIDTIGVGVGVVSRVKEELHDQDVIIQACHFGEGVGSMGKELKPREDERLEDRRSISAKKRFLNRKSEQYFRLRDLFIEGQIEMPKDKNLIDELMKMRWEMLGGTRKIKIIDPEDKSPDFADALVYFIWKSKKAVLFDFGGSQ